MDERDGSKPPAGWLNHLHEAGHWSRLIEMARRSLAVDPNDCETHRHIAWAYAKSDRLPEMRGHVDFLLHAEPIEPRNHHLAAIYYLDTNQHGKARTHLDLLLREDPNSATYHYLGCIYALRVKNDRDARSHIQKARALSPNWAAAAHLEIKMDGARERQANQAWARINRLKQTLSMDPRDSSVMITIGDIFLKELEQPREAESFYRNALAITPTDKQNQAKLLGAIRARSLFYRTLSLPATVWRRIENYFQREKGIPFVIRIIFTILAFQVFLSFLAWLIVVGIFFTPAARIYEWLVLADITRMNAGPRVLAPLRRALHWPLWLRVSTAMTLIFGAWLLVLSKIFGVAPMKAFGIVTLTFGAHVGLVGFFVQLRKLRARLGLWQESLRLRATGSAAKPNAA